MRDKYSDLHDAIKTNYDRRIIAIASLVGVAMFICGWASCVWWQSL